MMRTYGALVALAMLSATMLAGCEVIGGIFKAGLWIGIILVLIIGGLAWWLFSKFRS